MFLCCSTNILKSPENIRGFFIPVSTGPSLFYLNIPSSLCNLFSDIFIYSGFNSKPIKFLLSLRDTNAVVPAPIKGSKTIPPSGHPALMQSTIKSCGKVAKCASLKGFVVTVQTLFLLASAPPIKLPSLSKLPEMAG